MQFSKDELSFLNIHVKCSDTKQKQNDKFQIKTDMSKQSVTFSLISDSATVITVLSKKVEEDFSGVYPVNQFLSLVQSTPKDAVLDIKNDGIHFNNNRYEFEKFDLDTVYMSVDESLDAFNKSNESKVIVDFGKTKNSFIGQEPLDYVLAMDKKFISALTCDTLVCSYLTSNEAETTFFIPKLATVLCNEAKMDKVEFKSVSLDKNEEKFYAIKIGDTVIIFNNKDYNKDMASLLDEESKPLYDHPTKITISKEVLKEALNRIKVFSSKNIYSRVYCSTTNNQFKVESKEQNSGYAVEIVDAEIDEAIQNQSPIFCVSQAYISTVLSYLKGDWVIIHANVYSPEGVATKITDEVGEDFFILCFVPE